jgi:hypothetical protein
MKIVIVNSLDAILEHLNDLDNNGLVSIHNQYCQNCNYSDDEIYNNDDEFFNIFFESKVLEAVRAVSYGEYRYQDDFVKFNGYGNLESFNNPSEHIDLNSIASDILENPDNYDIELEESEEE